MTVSPKFPSEHDQQLLSAYLDGALPDREKAMLEQRLARDPALRAELDHLRETVALLRDLPRLRAPRDFTLNPQIYVRPVPWWKRLFTLDMALQFTGALGAATAMILIVAAVLLTGGDRADQAGRLGEQSRDGTADTDQQASQVALQITATALRRTLTLDDTAIAEKTRISFAGDEFQSTMAAQSAYYATHFPTTTLLPSLTEAPVPAPVIEADEAQAGVLSTEDQIEGEDGAVPSAQQAVPEAPPGAEQENTMMQEGEAYAPAEAADTGLAAPTAGFGSPMTNTPAADVFREEPDDAPPTEFLEALENEPAITFTPIEAAVIASGTPESSPTEQRGADGSEGETSPDWLLIGVGAIVLAASALLFGIGRRMARG